APRCLTHRTPDSGVAADRTGSKPSRDPGAARDAAHRSTSPVPGRGPPPPTRAKEPRDGRRSTRVPRRSRHAGAHPTLQEGTMSVTTATRTARRTLFVNTFTDGLLDPEREMLGPVQDGGTIVATTAPGCWGPMITPRLRGGHEVTEPVAVDGAEPGDAVVLRVQELLVTSIATASGHDRLVEGHCLSDPYVAARCPGCGELCPETDLNGIGPEAVRCTACGTAVMPFMMENGYTVVFDDHRTVGVTVDRQAAERIAREA